MFYVACNGLHYPASTINRSLNASADTSRPTIPLPHNPFQGTSNDDQELLNDLIGFLDQRIQDATNPRRRDSIELCQDFVKKHGYPGPPEIDLRSFI
ncbi:hypothetical protein LA080_011495 [Diaporthe eres]|nr:hypothetical protein LA080_011495 [Diaporthe eres]